MSHSRMIIFDDGLGELGPMTDLRSAFEIRTGVETTAERIIRMRPESVAAYWVPQHLKALVAERIDGPVNSLPDDATIVCVNGRWGLPNTTTQIETGEAIVEESTGHVVIASLSREDADTFLNTTELNDSIRKRCSSTAHLIYYPWDVLKSMKETISADIESTRIPDAQVPGGHIAIVGDHPVEIHQTARIYPHVVFDTDQGPVIVHEHAAIRPGAVICGPTSIGPHSTVIDRTLIKANTVIGPHCKVGGEIGSTIFQGCSNKAHDGHLGDSWIGEWVNFGAGTTNSNLLNTYGEVKMKLTSEGEMHRTGMAFLGAVIGDHVKLAINTRIMTGSVIGTGAMIAQTAPPPQFVNPFTWLTDLGEDVFQFEKFLKTAKAMMTRRDVNPSEPYIEALRWLHSQSHC